MNKFCIYIYIYTVKKKRKTEKVVSVFKKENKEYFNKEENPGNF